MGMWVVGGCVGEWVGGWECGCVGGCVVGCVDVCVCVKEGKTKNFTSDQKINAFTPIEPGSGNHDT